MNCDSVHFFGWPTVKRSHLPRHDGAANALQRVFRPGKPSPRQRNFGESSCIDELSVISSVSVSFCRASRSHRTTTRSPKSNKAKVFDGKPSQLVHSNRNSIQMKRKLTFSQFIVWRKLMARFWCFDDFKFHTISEMRIIRLINKGQEIIEKNERNALMSNCQELQLKVFWKSNLLHEKAFCPDFPRNNVKRQLIHIISFWHECFSNFLLEFSLNALHYCSLLVSKWRTCIEIFFIGLNALKNPVSWQLNKYFSWDENSYISIVRLQTVCLFFIIYRWFSVLFLSQ